jgi:Phospholipase_D-nuclease N-terminal
MDGPQLQPIQQGKTHMFGMEWNDGFTFGYLFSLVLGLWAVFNILQNDREGPLGKAIWSVLVLFVPYLGFIGWLLIGPKSSKK